MFAWVWKSGEAVSTNQRAFTHTPAQKQPPSAGGTQTPALRKLQGTIRRNGCADWQRQLETYSQDSWSKLGVFISFQKRRVSSFITWSTAARRRRCRRRQKHWRRTSLSWRLRYTMIKVTPTIEKWSIFKFCKRAPSLRSPHTFSSTQVMIFEALFKYNLY